MNNHRHDHHQCYSSSLSANSPHFMVAKRKQPLQHENQQQLQQQFLQQHLHHHGLQSANPPPPPPPSSTSPGSPFTVAHIMADSIHSKVRTMLNKTRLTRKTEHIQFLQANELITHGLLGAGAFSQVTAVTNTRDGRRYACKHLQPKLLQNAKGFLTAATELAYETHLLSSLQHPHIVQVHGWAANGIASFEQGQHDSFFLLLDLLDETLDQRIDQWKLLPACTLTEMTVRKVHKLRILSQIANALEYIHGHGVVFRDLKPQNIGLLQGHVKLFDFGLSRELPLLDTTSQRFQMSGKVGTIRYMAPEVCLYQPYNVHCDVYSWSMVAYETWSQQRPFEGFTPELYQTLVCQQGLRPCDPAAQQLQQQHLRTVSMSLSNVQAIPADLGIILEQAWHAIPERRIPLGDIQRQLNLLIQAEQEDLLALDGGCVGSGLTVGSSCSNSSGSSNSAPRYSTTMVPPPPPVPTVSPEQFQPMSSHDSRRDDNDVVMSNTPQFQHRKTATQLSLFTSPGPSNVIDLSSDDDDDNDDLNRRMLSVLANPHQHSFDPLRMGMSNETPTMMRRKKASVHHVKKRVCNKNRLIPRQRSLNVPSPPPPSGIGIPVRRRHSSDDFDQLTLSNCHHQEQQQHQNHQSSLLSDPQDFVSELQGHGGTDESTLVPPKRHRSADSAHMSHHMAAYASRQSTTTSSREMGSHPPATAAAAAASTTKVSMNGKGNSTTATSSSSSSSSSSSWMRPPQQPISSSSNSSSTNHRTTNLLTNFEFSPPSSKQKQRSWNSTTTASTSLEDTWSEDSNFVFEQWTSGSGSGNHSSYF